MEEAILSQHFREFCYERVERASLDEKIQISYEYLTWTKMLPVLKPESSKSVSKAIDFRTNGNDDYSYGDESQALLYYTRSVAFAPSGSQELAFAYANRSLAWLNLSRYHEGILDINRALQENYPKSLTKKLLNRKKKCAGDFQEAVILSKKAPAFLGKHYLLGKATLEELVTSFDPDASEPPAFVKIPPPKIDFKNKTIPNASGKIEMKITPENKVNIVATEDIDAGEILAIEEPFVPGLKQEFSYTHCTYCFVQTEALIHCPDCSVVMYCSTGCREKAFEKFHRIECQIFSKLSPEDEGVSLITWGAFRTILVATGQGQKLDEIMNHPVYKFPLSNKIRPDLKSQFDSQDYSSVFHYGQFSSVNCFNDFSSGLTLTPLITVAMWIYLLRHTSFFGEDKIQNLEKPLTRRELFVAYCFLRSLQVDFRAIREGFYNLSEPIEKCESRIIGHGIFPFMNLFSHSCEPHVSMFSYENNLVCRSIRPIKAGEQIFDCYGRPFQESPKDERSSSLLNKFNFKCQCEPCAHNWPVLEKLPKSFPKVVSDAIDAEKFEEYVSRFRELLKGLNFQLLSKSETLEFLCEYSSILDRRFERPCREFIDCSCLLELSLSTAANFYHIISK